ncbi:hypothetical protein L7F22_047965 [Adiantum nelumboides]|nr:hypothetical protein [Adiantum nelumboides]
MEKECLEGVSQWNAKEVSQFVKGYLGSDRYTRTILKNNINGSSLLHMSVPSWEALGVDITGHRVALHSWAKDKLSTSTNHLPQEKHVSNNEKVSSSTLSLQDEVSPIQKKFLNADLTKDKETREQIKDFIRRKRKTLLSFGGTGDKDGEYMSVKVIFQKLNQHRRYLRFKAMPLSHGKSKRCPSLSIDLEDFENQPQDSLDSMEAPKALMDNHKEYQESVSPPRNVPTMADDCYGPVGFHEMVSIMGSPRILSNENINCRYGLFPEGMQQQFVFIPFLDGDTKEVGIGTIFSKSYGGNTYAKWKVEIESINQDARECYIPGSVMQLSCLHVGQVIEVPVVYLKTLESKSTSELLLSKEESPSSSLQQRSSVQSTTEGAKESYEALLEANNTPKTLSTYMQSSSISPEYKLGHLEKSKEVTTIPNDGSSTKIQSSSSCGKNNSLHINVTDQNSWDDYPLSENLLIDLDHSNEAVKEVCKSKKRNLNPSHGTVTLSTHDKTLKKTTKEAIALKLMGEHNIDFMYRRLDSYLKELQRTTPKGSFDFKKECEDSEALDVLVSWALGQNKIKLKDTNGKDIGQEEVEFL